MFNFLHSHIPHSVLIEFGPIKIYWYGLFIVTGIILGTLIAIKLAKHYGVKKDDLIDSIFWLTIGGILGARIYHIFLELPFYIEHPLNILMIWRGGLAIHGAILAGLIIIYLHSRKIKIKKTEGSKNKFANFLVLSSIYAPALAIGQAIGRWGNYFNQELFGKPTDVPWGIPIEIENRVSGFMSFDYFHPTFLYESIGSLFIFIILISLHRYIIKKNKFTTNCYLAIIGTYLILYSILRFSLEFIRIDSTPELLGLRLPQIASILIVLFSIYIMVLPKLKKHANISSVSSHTK